MRVALAAAIVAAVLTAALPALRSTTALGATAACTADPSWPAADSALAQQVITLVNQHRESLGLGDLAIDTTLSDSAVWKARHMAEYDYFGHDDPAPPVARDAYTRALQCGYTADASWGENIAEGETSAAQVMADWLNSPGHKMNIEYPAFQAIGVGVATDVGGNVFWVQDFGSVVFSPGSGHSPSPAPVAPVTSEPSPPATTTAPPVTTAPVTTTSSSPAAGTPALIGDGTRVGAALIKGDAGVRKVVHGRKLAAGKLRAAKPRAGAPYSVRLPLGRVHVAHAALAVHCAARLAGLPMTGSGSIAGETATCTWKIPADARGAHLLVRVTVSGHRLALVRSAHRVVAAG